MSVSQLVGYVEQYNLFRVGEFVVGINGSDGDVEVFVKLSQCVILVDAGEGSREALPIDSILQQAFVLAQKVQMEIENENVQEEASGETEAHHTSDPAAPAP